MSTSSPTTTTTSRRPTFRSATLTSPRRHRSTGDRHAAPLGDAVAVRTARRDRGGLDQLHLRPGDSSEYLKAAVKFEVGETLNIRGSLELVNNQYSRNDTEIARGRFRMREMCWRSAPPMKTGWCGLSSSAMRWRQSDMSTPPPARSCRAWTW